LEGDKISTSRNWAVWLHEYLEEFPGKQDVLRYVLTANAPETKDNDFTWKDFQARNNNELVGNLGNFINRVLVLTNKYYDGNIPNPNNFDEIDLETLKKLKEFPKKNGNLIERYRFREALSEYMNLARLGNKYLAEEEPWKQVKTNPERVQSIMYVALQIAAALAILGEIFLPFTSKKLKRILHLDNDLKWDDVSTKDILLPAGHKIEKPELLFEKIDDETVEKQVQKLLATKKQNKMENQSVEPQKPEITFDDFIKQDIRTATILKAEKLPKADKLLVLKVDTGIDKRTIVSGIAQHFKPEEIIGKQVLVLVNLKPRKLRGVESQGMILMTEDAEGNLVFVSPEKIVPDGKNIS